MAFVDVFTGDSVSPSELSYRAVALIANALSQKQSSGLKLFNLLRLLPDRPRVDLGLLDGQRGSVDGLR